MKEKEKDLQKAKGGHARAKALSKKKRSEIAQKAAEARWTAKTEYTGELDIAGAKIPCAVIETKSGPVRIVVQREVVGLLTGNKKGGLLRYLSPKNLQPYLPNKFKDKSLDQSTYVVEILGKKAHGLKGEDIVDICKMYLEARKDNKLHSSQTHLADKAELIITALAKTGITALIDEVTGYQKVRARDALQEYINKVIRKELAAWVKRFPMEFYSEMYRLNGWKWTNDTKHPMLAAKYTADIVYSRLGPNILEELQKRNPRSKKGHRKAKHHQWLTEDVGHPQLAQHLYAVINFMKASDSWKEFKMLLDKALPKYAKNQNRLFS